MPIRGNLHRRRRTLPIRQLLAGRTGQYWHYRELPSVDSYSLRCLCIYCWWMDENEERRTVVNCMLGFQEIGGSWGWITCTICRPGPRSLASLSSWCATTGGWKRTDTFCWSVENSDYLHYLWLMDYLQSLGSVTLLNSNWKWTVMKSVSWWMAETVRILVAYYRLWIWTWPHYRGSVGVVVSGQNGNPVGWLVGWLVVGLICCTTHSFLALVGTDWIFAFWLVV